MLSLQGWMRLGVGVSLLFSLQIQAKIQFSRGISPSQEGMIQKDLNLLPQLNLLDVSGEFQKIFRIEKINQFNSQINSREVEHWLQDRVQYILDQDHPFNETNLRIIEGENSYPQHSLPQYPLQSRERGAANTRVSSNVLMTNIGTLLYRAGKDIKAPYELTIEGIGPVLVNSPRVGILQVGPAFMQPAFERGALSQIQHFVNSVYRLSTLFHEARHSDGNGLSLGFIHALCPKGHMYENKEACDEAANGPYRIGALFLNAVEKGCSDCSEGERDALRLLRNDSIGRILSPGYFYPEVSRQSPRTEQDKTIREGLCEVARSLGQRIPACLVSQSQVKALFWNDQPEGMGDK